MTWERSIRLCRLAQGETCAPWPLELQRITPARPPRIAAGRGTSFPLDDDRSNALGCGATRLGRDLIASGRPPLALPTIYTILSAWSRYVRTARPRGTRTYGSKDATPNRPRNPHAPPNDRMTRWMPLRLSDCVRIRV